MENTVQFRLAQAIARHFYLEETNHKVDFGGKSYPLKGLPRYFTGKQKKLLLLLIDWQVKTNKYLIKRTKTRDLTKLIYDTNKHLHKYRELRNIRIVALRGHMHGNTVLRVIAE